MDEDLVAYLEKKIKKLEAELAAAPKWVPVDEFKNDREWHIVFTEDGAICKAKFRSPDSCWLVAWSSERVNVTHVLVNLRPPVTRQWPLPDNPRGDNAHLIASCETCESNCG